MDTIKDHYIRGCPLKIIHKIMTFMQLENKFENDATTHISMIDKLIIYFNIRNQVYSSSVDFYCP